MQTITALTVSGGGMRQWRLMRYRSNSCEHHPGDDPPVITDTTVVTPEDTPITVCKSFTDVDAGIHMMTIACGLNERNNHQWTDSSREHGMF